MITLVGILVVAIGFAFRFNPLLVVMAAGIATGLAAGISFHDTLALIGQYFVDNRFVTLAVVLIVPVVGLLERHGLQERAAALIRRARKATSGRVLFLYHAFRAAASSVGLSVGGHASMVRPMVAPMAEGAAAAKLGALAPVQRADIRAHAAAAENLGNFFADDIFVAVGPVLLIKAFFDSVGVPVSGWQLGLWGAPTALFVLAAGWWRYRALDARLAGLPVRQT